MKKIFMVIGVLALTGCAGIIPEPLKQTTTFNVDQAKRLMQDGKSTISGTAFIRQSGGGIVTCAGLDVRLIPVTEYTTERMKYLYGESIETSVGILDNPFKKTPVLDSEAAKLVKTTVCNKDGEFVFNNIVDGDFYLVATVVWNVGNLPQGGALGKRVNIKTGETKSVMLTLNKN